MRSSVNWSRACAQDERCGNRGPGRGTSLKGTSPPTSSSASDQRRPTTESFPATTEGDLIIGTGRSAIGTLVERSSRSTLLVHLPRLEGWGEKQYVKNGPSLGGYGAVAMNAALTASITKLPEQLRKTLTWDRGKELSGHALFALETGTRVFFADPHSPWQRPTNEKHQWPAAAVLPERNRPFTVVGTRP